MVRRSDRTWDVEGRNLEDGLAVSPIGWWESVNGARLSSEEKNSRVRLGENGSRFESRAGEAGWIHDQHLVRG